ncbi:PTS system protein [Klebsiella pneumoniae subsp. ozaenae]|uniref:PTS system protein n=1 Tax=Klebsiella pneumoniae subsp. ozaenae TaxID=574 RepID=A0A377Z9E9_KLEPO|nr:PTS system protein [Klebsiella pneumoniae subsp. ozaenae]
MKKIMLCCSAGMSTSLLMKKIDWRKPNSGACR